MLVRESLHSAPVTVPPTSKIEETAKLMATQGVGAVMVVSAGELVGIVTDRDICVRGIGAGLPVTEPISTVMTEHPVTIQGSADILDAFKLFKEGRGRRLPVLEEEELAGIISVDDLLVALVLEFSAAIAPIAREVVAPEITS